MSKERVIEILDQAQLDIMDARNIMDNNRHFHVAGVLQAANMLMSDIIRKAQQEY